MTTATLTAEFTAMSPPPKPEHFRVELPDSERGRSAHDIARLDVLNARLTKEPKARGRLSADDAREKDLKDRETLEHATALKADAQWSEAAANETADLAEARGEEVKRDAPGKVTVTSRDPLLSLLRAGRLTTAQYDTGLEVRDLYERRHEGLGSQMGGIGGGSSPTYDNSQTVFYGVQRAKALQRVGRIEQAVLTGSFRADDARLVSLECWAAIFADDIAPPHVALQMIRLVCEDGHSIRSASAGGRSFDRNATALARALDVADAVIRGK